MVTEATGDPAGGDACVQTSAESAWYFELLGPLGLAGDSRFPTYHGTEEAVYLRCGTSFSG